MEVIFLNLQILKASSTYNTSRFAYREGIFTEMLDYWDDWDQLTYQPTDATDNICVIFKMSICILNLIIFSWFRSLINDNWWDEMTHECCLWIEPLYVNCFQGNQIDVLV